MNKPAIAHQVEGEEVWWQLVREQVSSLKFGIVQITVHESRVVQIERTEKLRLGEHRGISGQRTFGQETERGVGANALNSSISTADQATGG